MEHARARFRLRSLTRGVRRSKSITLWLVGSGFFLVALQFWMLVVVSRWIIQDSHALQAFPAAHPTRGLLVALLWNVGDFGGVAYLR